MNRDTVSFQGSGRRWSLRREWSRAFSIMLLGLLVTAAVTIVGVRGVVDQVEGTAHQLHLESKTVTALTAAIVSHEEAAHKLLGNKPLDRSAFVAEQQKIAGLFDQAITIFPTSNGMKGTVITARHTWQAGLMTYGLWSTQLPALHGDHSVDNPLYGALSDGTVGLLVGLEVPSLNSMDAGLTYGSNLERVLVLVLSGLFVLGLGATAYFRRRMAKTLLKPVAAMYDNVLKLEAGDYNHRMEVVRRDELGELAQAFNRMSEALHESHVALTLRATHDSLTGLANRAALTERLTASFRSGSQRRVARESLLFIDIDDFKDVNDTKGHEGGDALLIQLATRLNGCVRAQDLVARLGGDEFAIMVMEDEDGGSVAIQVAERVLNALQTPFSVTGELMVVTVSIGVAQRTSETADAAELLRQADFAMYMAKGGGKARYQLFDAQMHEHMVERSALKTNLAVAVAAGQLHLEYQPIANLRTGEILGVEALVRWQHPTLGLLQPETFIPLAEQTGDIDAIGCWVLDTATRQVATWRQTMDHCQNLWVSVNLSALQLVNPQSLAAIQHILADPTTQADKVVVEVTAAALAADLSGSTATLNTLKGLGARIAIHGAGTDSASLLTLAAAPVDILKIDGCLVAGQASAAQSAPPTLEGIIAVASELSLPVIAEGIDGPDQLDLLRRLGCNMGQGYFLSWPASAHDFETTLASGGLLPLGPSTEVGFGMGL